MIIGEQAQLARVNQICTLKHDTMWCFWMCRCTDHLLLFHSSLTSSCFYSLWHLAQWLYVCSIALSSTLNLPSLWSLTGLPDLLLPLVSSATSRLVLLGADIVLARSPSHQSPACGIFEHRKAPPWQMPVKTLFHPVLLSLSLQFLVSYGQLWPRLPVFPIRFALCRPITSDQCLALAVSNNHVDLDF